MPDTKTTLAYSARRQPWLEAVCRRLGLDPSLHRDRVQAYQHCLRQIAEAPVTGTEAMAGAITLMIRGVALGIEREFRRGRGHPAWQRMQEEAWVRYVDALQAEK